VDEYYNHEGKTVFFFKSML